MQRAIIDGRYVLGDLLGSGGMADVYLAHDRVLDRNVALKVLNDRLAANAKFANRFEREVRHAAALSHPNVVSVYDGGEAEDGHYFMVMEYVPGGTLKGYLAEHAPLESRRAVAVAVQILEALREAHGKGFVHRDIKPENVLITATGDVKVADFGIARAAEEAEADTSSILGTPKYMSPEQALGEPVTPRSDLYSLGVVLYEMLAGSPPFEADTPVAVSMMHVNRPPRPLGDVRPDVRPELHAVVERLLAKAPEDRHESADEVLGDLYGVLAGRAMVAAPVGGAPSIAGGEVVGRRRWLAPVLVTLIALVAVVGGVLGWRQLQAEGDPGIVGALEGLPREVARQANDLVAPERVAVPGVVGLDREQARDRLDEVGLVSGLRFRPSMEADEGKVLEQSASSGTKAQRGSKILLAVGSGPQDDAPDAAAPVEDASAVADTSPSGDPDATERTTPSYSTDDPAPATPSSATPSPAAPVAAPPDPVTAVPEPSDPPTGSGFGPPQEATEDQYE